MGSVCCGVEDRRGARKQIGNSVVGEEKIDTVSVEEIEEVF
jgi:hypothetical protein